MSRWPILLLLAGGCAAHPTQPPARTDTRSIARPPADADTTLAEAVASSVRSPEHRARDRYRHPQQTLAFFGIKPDMTVIELWPGLGWYTEILAPLLSAKGKLIEVLPGADDAGASERTRLATRFADKLAANPDVFGRVEQVHVAPPQHLDFGKDDSADLVLTFRNFHNWLKGGYADAVVRAAYRALKPGGVFGVVEHRAAPGTTLEQMKQTGYVSPEYIIREAEAVGFTLVGSSEINANPSDTKNYPAGVWTLPPTFRLGDKQRARYAAIGESDRMTLKFVKPSR